MSRECLRKRISVFLFFFFFKHQNKTTLLPSSVICFSFPSAFPPFVPKSLAKSCESCGIFLSYIVS